MREAMSAAGMGGLTVEVLLYPLWGHYRPAPAPGRLRFAGEPVDAAGTRRLMARAAYLHSCSLASRAPSAIAASFAQVIFGSTGTRAAKVAKPQSLPAMTFSRPTTPA